MGTHYWHLVMFHGKTNNNYIISNAGELAEAVRDSFDIFSKVYSFFRAIIFNKTEMLPFFISWTDFKNSFGQIDFKKKTML